MHHLPTQPVGCLTKTFVLQPRNEKSASQTRARPSDSEQLIVELRLQRLFKSNARAQTLNVASRPRRTAVLTRSTLLAEASMRVCPFFGLDGQWPFSRKERIDPDHHVQQGRTGPLTETARPELLS